MRRITRITKDRKEREREMEKMKWRCLVEIGWSISRERKNDYEFSVKRFCWKKRTKERKKD